ncbi:tetratricopeptide repeat protein [Anaeromyxobacter sp. SG17]|uniref:tetratricopeptide repeat protein n=1 Tax=Anaeromyxobacter sp. SG17 TaxID=2925405 RepID=UPI001F5A8FC7|nr:tetratricopeptide repeat protein [Anaeromyxobacter sp. SG17]
MKAVTPSAAQSLPPLQRRAVAFAPLVALLVLALAAYSNSFGGDFVFDDVVIVRDRRLLHDLGAFFADPGWILRENRWVGYLTFALNHRINGIDVTGYHLVNFAVHVGNALLVYALVLATFATPRLEGSLVSPWSRAIAFLAAAGFVAHPLQTQAVTYIVQRFTSLATLFYLLSTLQYARWRLRLERGPMRPARTALAWAGILAAAVLAMKTKEIAFTLPFAVAAYELVFFDGSARLRVKLLAPLLATLPIIPIGRLGVGTPLSDVLSTAADATRVQTALSRSDYLATQLPVIASYLRLLVLPFGQNVDHDVSLQHSFVAPVVIGGGLLLLGMVALAAFLLWRTSPTTPRPLDPACRLVAFGIVWFFLALSVESSLIPIVDVMVEHRVYLPSAGAFAAVATAGALFSRRLGWKPWAFVTAGALVAIVLAGVTLARNRVWKDESTLWSDAALKSPAKVRPAHNLGLALAAAGRHEEALQAFANANRADPTRVDVYSDIGAALRKLGRDEEAANWFRAAIRQGPEYPDAYFNLGSLVMDRSGNYAEAAALFERAIALRPDYAAAYANYAAALNRLGRPAEAIARLEPVAATLSENGEARFNLGVSYAMVGNYAAAQRETAALTRLAPERARQLSAYVAQLSNR